MPRLLIRFVLATDPEAQWCYAKTCVRVADWNVHEFGSHFALSHVVSEIACVLTHHNLPADHPLFQLLLPHFHHNIPLDNNARTQLVPKFMASRLSGLNTSECFALCAAIYKQWNFEKHYVPNELEQRGVSELPEELYPFKATALLVWTNIKAYVTNVLQSLHDVDGTSKSLLTDVYVKQWCNDMKDNIPGFPVIKNVAQLCDAVTMIIYTATHQHAAVNYFQQMYMAYVPAAPGVLSAKPPADLCEIDTVDFTVSLYLAPILPICKQLWWIC